jgi:hypothetical protein
MKHEAIDFGLFPVRKTMRAYRNAPQSRPLRVLPLAMGAVFLTVSVAALAEQASRELSHGRYAEEIIRDHLSCNDQKARVTPKLNCT